MRSEREELPTKATKKKGPKSQEKNQESVVSGSQEKSVFHKRRSG